MFKKIFFLFCVLLLTFSVSGCFKKNPSVVPETGANKLLNSLASQNQLKKFSNPAEVKSFFANRPSQGAAGYSATDSFIGREETASKVAAPGGFGAGPAVGLGGGSGFSGTNIQVAGVDEADIVKTDGQFIYTVNGKNLTIVKATPAAEAVIVSTTKLAGRAQELFIKDNRLVVFGYDDTAYAQDGKTFIRPISSYVFLSVYDITDRPNPQHLKTLKFEGGYTAARLIDNRLYFITTTYNFWPAGDFILPKVLENDQQISAEQSSAKYAYPDVYYIDGPFSYNSTTVSLLLLDDLDRPLRSQVYFMPSGQIVYASQNNLYLTYTKYISDYQLRINVARELLFARLPVKDRERINAIDQIDSAILSDDEKASKIDQVIQGYFASLPDNELKIILEQLDKEFSQRYQAVYKELEKTIVHKIKLDGDNLVYSGSGEVSGHVLNQFSLDEDDNYFRIATTRGQTWVMPFMAMSRFGFPQPENVQESYNNLFVLDDNLKIVGQIENLAVGERIYSVRFIGQRAYVVTFKQTDPLFVIDLTEPTAPRVAGQLKIPGFSSYLHPYDENTLIGVGKEAIDKGDQGVELLGLKVSLFDVSDMANPKELSSLKLGGNGSDTSVLYDHKAFLFWAAKNLIVLPVSLTAAGSTNYNLQFQGAVAFAVADGKLTEAGRIPLEMIQRTLYIDDYLYSLSPSILQVNSLVDFSVVSSIKLPVAEQSSNPIPLLEERSVQ